MTTTKRSHIGRAGDHAVMAEFLLRGWNVAIPEVDVGDDIFVVDDNADRLIRVQVKAADRVRTTRDGVRAAYAGISLAQFWGGTLPFFYVFVLRDGRHWDFVIVSRERLRELRAEVEAETERRPGRPMVTTRPTEHPSAALDAARETLTLMLTFGADDVTLWGHSLQVHRNDWAAFPVVTEGPGATARAASRSASATPRRRPPR